MEGVPSIMEAAAVGIPAPGGGPEQLVLFLVPKGKREDVASVKRQCQAAIRSKLNPLFKVERVSSVLLKTCGLPEKRWPPTWIESVFIQCPIANGNVCRIFYLLVELLGSVQAADQFAMCHLHLHTLLK